MLYVKTIETNIKHPGGIKVNTLTPRVFLTGSNGSGKTAILNALQLALTGEAHDLGIKDKAKTSTLLRHLLPEGEEELYARVELVAIGVTSSDHAIYTFEWALVPGKKAKRSIPKDAPKPRLLIPEVEAALKGTKQTMLRFLTKYFGRQDIQRGHNVLSWSAGTTLQGAKDLPWSKRILLTEAAARKSMNQHKAGAKALRVALEQLGGSEASDGAVIASAIATLTGFQLGHKLPICGVCGQETSMNVLQERHEKAKSKVGDEPVSSRISALKYAAEQADRQAKEAEELVGYCLKAMEADVKHNLTGILRAINHRTPAEGGDDPFGLTIEKSSIYFTFNGDPLVSGAESTWLLAAVASGIINQDNSFHLITTPDRAFDHRGIADFLKAFGSEAGPNQIFVQCPIQPRGRLSSKWCKVDMDEQGA